MFGRKKVEEPSTPHLFSDPLRGIAAQGRVTDGLAEEVERLRDSVLDLENRLSRCEEVIQP